MKKAILLFSLVLLIGCKSKTTVINTTPEEAKIIKLNLSAVNPEQRSKAYELGKRVLMTCNTSKFKPFNESEATLTVIKNTTEEKLTKTCTKFRQFYGTFKDLDLIEVYKNNVEQTTVYRYKALYTKKVANKELRVTINEQNKVSSIKSLDWVDTFESK